AHNDKIAHFVAYAGLAFLLTSAVLVTQPFRWRLLIYVLLVIAVYGAFDELTQIPVGRTADIQDWIADCVGATIGMSAALAIGMIWNRMRSGSSPVADASSVGRQNEKPAE
ncbi:MAG TPA: VanZ family protein, partial [Pirellulaceae bacterium]|nr:VanZ family protein [Pirellulaceae bacterium]